MDDASAENINALAELARDLIAKEHQTLDDITQWFY
jgi:hypothetical protein